MSLLQELIALGEQLPPEEKPSSDQVPQVIGALIYQEEHDGSLEPPAPAAEAPSGAADPKDAEIERLRAELAAAQSEEQGETEPGEPDPNAPGAGG
jgi:hypothetical protein